MRLNYIPRKYTPIIYGLLYNWYAVTSVSGITSNGWHVPTEAEVNTLITYLGGSSVAGGKLKESGFLYWNSPNTGGNNSSRFNGRAAGFRDSASTFTQMKNILSLRVSDGSGSNGRDCYMFQLSASIIFESTSKKIGYSLRIIKDTTTLTNGQSGIYVGNDGKVYRTICIGGQEWIADNLAETMYRGGIFIPEVTVGATWSGLTTEGMCAYLNNWIYV